VDLSIIADDLTGAADSGVQLKRSGYRTAVVFRGAELPPEVDLDAVAVDTDSRSSPAGFAAKRVLEAGRAMNNAHVIYKKIDSTLRGPIAAELAAALGATGRTKAVVAPAFPSARRTTCEGMQLVNGKPVHQTGLAHDPSTPVSESHIPSLLSEAFSSVALSVAEVRDVCRVHEALESADCVVADAGSDDDLEALVRAVPDPSTVLWVGSAGLARAFGKVYPGPRSDAPSEAPIPASGVLAVVGSVNEVAREQLRCLAEEPGVAQVALDTVALAAGSREEAVGEAAEAVRAALSGNRGAVLYSAAGEGVDSALRERSVSKDEISGRVADALAEVVATLSGEERFDTLVLTGGDTAVRVARALGATGILLEGEIEAGVPNGTLIGPRPYRVVTKAGGFGGSDTLREAFRALANPRKEAKA
jgi:D-threonate/D-erythronate kinase